MTKYQHAHYGGANDIALSHHTNLDYGLSQAEYLDRLEIHGFNEFDCSDKQTIFSKYLEQFKNPLIQLLIASTVISVLMGQWDDAISISLAVIIVVTVAFVQEYRSEKSLQELNKLVPPTCRAIRDGRLQEFLAKNLVPGDVVLITTGDRVPADLKIVEANDLTIDESNLTGETESVYKTTESKASMPLLSNNYNNNNYLHQNGRDSSCDVNSLNSNLAFMGTLVQSGHGKGVVCATGDSTQFGSVFKMMQAEEAPRSPLQSNMDQLGNHLSICSLVLIAIIVVIGWLQSRPIVEMFTIGVSLAVAAIPEGLPIVVTVTLALGVMRMAKRKAVVKKLPAVETVGCLQVLCCDKTGTLTKNEMTVSHIATSELFLSKVTGIGYEEYGDIILEDLKAAEQRTQIESIERALRAAVICNNAKFDSYGKLLGLATEGAMLVAARKAGIERVREEFVRLEEIPFSSQQKYMAVKCQSKISGYDKPYFYVKGALEILLMKCTSYSNQGVIIPLDDLRRKEYMRQSENYEHLGLRVLAIASGVDMDHLVFLGALGIHDPPKNGVKETIGLLQEGNIHVKMITGDSRITAQSIARSLGIMNSTVNHMSGQELDNLINMNQSLQYKAEKISNIAVFYRTTPAHKVIIVKMLQSYGLVVGMTGDGVNDGAALKKADIGISMGLTGTDVCKEASDVILMDDNLSTIIVALEEGKGIYYNIRNFIKFQLSTSIAALSLIALSTILKIPNPLNAMQILYINVLMDGPPAQSLGVEEVDLDVLRQPPRNVKQPVLTRDLIVGVVMSSIIILGGTMLVFITEMSDGVVTRRDTTMTFTCFVLFDLFNALACRSQTKSIFQVGFFTNKTFLIAAGGSLLGQLLVIYVPIFQGIFQTEALYFSDLIFLTALSSTVFIASEITKLYKNITYKRRLLRGASMFLV